MTRLLLTARDLFLLGLGYVVLSKLMGDAPTMTGYAVVIACTCLYRSHRTREAAPAADNVVPFPAAAK